MSVFAPTGPAGPATAMAEIAKTAAYDPDSQLYSAFYCTEDTTLTFFGHNGEENTIQCSLYQIYPCYIRGVKDTAEFSATAKVYGFRIY